VTGGGDGPSCDGGGDWLTALDVEHPKIDPSCVPPREQVSLPGGTMSRLLGSKLRQLAAGTGTGGAAGATQGNGNGSNGANGSAAGSGGGGAGAMDTVSAQAVEAAAVGFIGLLGSAANDISISKQRQTVVVEDVLGAIGELELAGISGRGWPEGLRAALEQFAAQLGAERAEVSRHAKGSGGQGGGEGGSSNKRQRTAAAPAAQPERPP
jgi:histone H3/H4